MLKIIGLLKQLKGGFKPFPLASIITKAQELKEKKNYIDFGSYVLSGLLLWYLIYKGFSIEEIKAILGLWS